MIMREMRRESLNEGYRDYDPNDKDVTAAPGETSASSGGFRGYHDLSGPLGSRGSGGAHGGGQSGTGGFRGYTDTEGPLPSRDASGAMGYSSHTGRLGDEIHDGSYEIPKWKVPSNLTDKQKDTFKKGFEAIKNADASGKSGRDIMKMLANMEKYYGHEMDVLNMAWRAYAEGL